MHGMKGRTAVLTYHDVIERRGSKALWFDCTAAELSSQLDWMKAQGVHFITLDQLYDYLALGKPLPAKAVAITFADNYQGFWNLGYPILKAKHIPVAMFVHTGYVGDTAHGRPKMDWDELKRLDREGLVTIASQTVTHPADLGRLSPAEQARELRESKTRLERELGHAVAYVAYPNGKFNPESMRQAKAAGYRMGFSEITKTAERSPSLFAVNRYVHTKFKKAIKTISAERGSSARR